MKTKRFLIVLLVALSILSVLVLSACQGEPPKDGKDGRDGRDGIGIVSIEKSTSFGLTDIYTIELSSGEKYTLKVNNGENGSQGVGVNNAYFNDKGELVIELTNDEEINCGKIPECEHSYLEWETIASPDCQYKGIKTRICSKCGYEEYELVEPSKHNYGEWIDLISNCTTKLKTRSCVACGNSQIEKEDGEYHSYKNRVCVICETKQPSEGIEYILSSDGKYYTVSGIGDCTALDVVIPAKHEGLPVAIIGNNAFEGADLTSIVIPDSVTIIDDKAFASCYSLTIYCEASSKPTSWNENWNNLSCPVVWDCNNNDVADDGCVYTVVGGIRYFIKDAEAIVARQPKSIVLATIQESIIYKDISYDVTGIFEDAFFGCEKVTSISIPDSISSIGNNALNCSAKCNEYENGLYLGNEKNPYLVLLRAKNIDETSFEINENTKIIYPGALAEWENLSSLIIPNGITSIGGGAFACCTSLQSVVIPNSVTSIGNYAFSECESLTSVYIPNSVTDMGMHLFQGCQNITIYCEATKTPDDWDFYWNSSNRAVEWGHTHSYTDGECVCGMKEN